MALALVVHDLGPLSTAAEQEFFESVFAIAPDHWRLTATTTFVATEVSTAYLLAHLRQAVKRAKLTPRMLLVAPVGPELATHGLTAEGEAWVREMLGP